MVARSAFPLSCGLLILIVACSEEAPPRYQPGSPLGQDVGGDADPGDADPGDVDAGGDPGQVIDGEDCTAPVVLTWDGSTIVRDDDTRPYQHDYLFETCVAGQNWHYPNRDLVYRLDFPVGSYRATLRPEWSYTYLSLIDVRTDGSCRDFDTSCVALADSEMTALNVVHNFEVAAGESIYLVVDSYGNLNNSEPDMREGPFTLTIESFAPASLGEACDSDNDCLVGVCLDVDYAGTGYCTDLCGNVDCGSGAVPMVCGDVGAIEYAEGTYACVAASEVGVLVEYDTCAFNFTCDSELCLWPTALWEGECRVLCSGSCAVGTCVDVTEDMYVTPSSPVSVCVPSADIGIVARNGECAYSYQCDPGDYCPMGVCSQRP